MTVQIIEYMAYAVEQDKPWFLGLGFHYPHLNWHVPQWTLDLYNATEINSAKNQDPPVNYIDVAMTDRVDGNTNFQIQAAASITGETETYEFPTPINQTLSDTTQTNLRIGYYAAISLTDYHVGLVLDSITRLGVENDTIIVLVSDHGWHLGEHRLWGKSTNFEDVARIPM
eukprot:UN34109